MSKRGNYYVPVSMSDALRDALRNPSVCTVPSEWVCGPAFSADLDERVACFEDELREAYRG